MLKTKDRQILINKRGNKCECCGLTEWLHQPIKLEVHHKDGNRLNDNEDNLEILCPNCHAYTENHSKNTYNHHITDEELVVILKNAESIHKALLQANLSTSGANYARARQLIQKYEITHLYKREKVINYCIDCGAPISDNATRCNKCTSLLQRKVDRPSREELKQLIRSKTFVAIGKQFGVSDTAIKKWCVAYNLPKTAKEIKSYSDEDWNKI